MIPQMIGRYQVIAEVGRGGMATVYRAVDQQVGREVAIKVLPRELLHSQEFRARFQREAEALAALEHPAIVPVYDVGAHDGQPYLVMRLMAGGSLADRLRQGPLSLGEAARIIGDLAPALAHAHAAGVVHRDLKPANILFDQHDRPYLADFGIVKLAQDTAQLTGAGSIGTPDYMAPEISRPGGLTPLIDIYALGVMTFQMLTGRLPYQADTPMGVLVAHITEPIPDLRRIRPDLPRAAESFVARALAKSPAERYQSAADLAADLASLSGGEAFTGATMRVAAPIIKPGNPLARSGAGPVALGRRLKIGAAGAVAFLLLSIFVIRPTLSRRAVAPTPAAPIAAAARAIPTAPVAQADPSRSARPPADRAPINSADMLIQLEYHVVGAAYSPALDRIAFIASSPDRLYIYDPVNGDSMAIGLSETPTGLALNPDGAFAAVAMAQHIAYVDLNQGKLVRTLSVSGRIDGIAVGTAQTIYAFSRNDGSVRLREIDAATNSETSADISPAPGGVRYRLLANGRGLYGITDGAQPGLEKIDVSGFHPKYSAAFPYANQYHVGPDLWLSTDNQRLFTACGDVFRTSDDRTQDMHYQGTLSDIPWVRSLYHVAATGKVLALPGGAEGEAPGCRAAPDTGRDDYMLVYDYASLAPVGRHSLPVLTINGTAYPVDGRYVFASPDGSKYYVVVQARSSTALPKDFAVLTINVER